MILGDHIKTIREEKKLSQGDIEKRTGLLRCYISRVENNHTVPAIETLEKIARALEMPLYQLMYDGDQPPASKQIKISSADNLFGARGKEARYLRKICRHLASMSEPDRSLLLTTAQKMTSRR